MRARGANVTDIAVLVVAAEDGVMPQTEEAISHAKAAGVPIVVALNKIDLPGANPQRVYEQLAANELLPSEWGGETEVVKTSATTGAGDRRTYGNAPDGRRIARIQGESEPACVRLLLGSGNARRPRRRHEIARPQRHASPRRRHRVRIDVRSRQGDDRHTLDSEKHYEEAGPSTPVNVTGLNFAPGAGDRFYVLDDISKARELAEQRSAESRARELSGSVQHVTLENLFERLGRDSSVRTLNIILRADVRGSIEAIRKELTKLEHPEVQIKILQATVGGITEADVHLAHASDAIIIGFSVVPDEKARQLADRLGVQIRRYDIIYQVTDDLRAALEGMLRPEKKEKEMGRALILRTFHISKVGTVAGCRVLAGSITRDFPRSDHPREPNHRRIRSRYAEA